MIFTYINIAILLVIALIHIYWAMGGIKGMSATVPTTADGKKLFAPGMLVTLFVAVALICFAYFHYAYYHIIGTIKQLSGYLLLAGVLVFLARTVGDFKYVGIFKKVRATQFARYDTYLYSPLCFVISVLAIITYFKHC